MGPFTFYVRSRTILKNDSTISFKYLKLSKYINAQYEELLYSN